MLVGAGGQLGTPWGAVRPGREVSPTPPLLSAFETTLTEGNRTEKRLFYATFATVSRGISPMARGITGLLWSPPNLTSLLVPE